MGTRKKYKINGPRSACTTIFCCIFGQNSSKIITKYLRLYAKCSWNTEVEILSQSLKGKQFVISFSPFLQDTTTEFEKSVTEFFNLTFLTSQPCAWVIHYNSPLWLPCNYILMFSKNGPLVKVKTGLFGFEFLKPCSL